MALSSQAKIHVIRLRPGEDLKKAIVEFAASNEFMAAVMVTCVGSLTEYNLRFANQKEGRSGTGHFEIVSLVGTVSRSSVHLHLCISDEKGMTTGGHLLDGNRVYTTAEIAIAELPQLEFQRTFDEASGYKELNILSR